MERVDYQSLVIQDIINLKRQEELNLNPWYQRRSVWNDNQKSYLINTLFARKPIPTIYIRHTIDLDKGKSIKEVVDGQQRIRAIISFYENEIGTIYPETNQRVKFSSLTNPQKRLFLMTPIPVGYLQGASDADVIDIFARINSVAKSLNAQEKRNAKYSGFFKQFCLNESTKRLEFFRQYDIFSANDFARMNEVLFMSDLVINLMDGLTRYSSGNVDKYYKTYDNDFLRGAEISSKLDSLFNVLIQLEPRIIKDTIFKRQPIFFSLVMALSDCIGNINVDKLAQGILDIDGLYHLDIADKEQEDIDFYAAVSATTQGKDQRENRDKYIKRHIL